MARNITFSADELAELNAAVAGITIQPCHLTLNVLVAMRFLISSPLSSTANSRLRLCGALFQFIFEK